MRVIPVLDLKAGQAVHAVAGERAHYRPVRSRLHGSSEPLGLARAYRDTLGLDELYLADLDAIAGAPPAVDLIRTLSDSGLRVWVDAGLRDRSGLAHLLGSGAAVVIVGLETVSGTDQFAEILAEAGHDRVAFSLDLDAACPRFAPGADWGTSDPLELAEGAIGLGVRQVILLDLARVGTGRGTGTISLLTDLASAHPDVEFVAGGGISGPSDLAVLARAGAAAVLVGSALHDGRIGRDDVA
ncbi:MAG TPA: HisA/HisF-related TIM barrel protein [Isosphaeraceae bacterium]|jgi:phosphoribosylformimino-5-aminoimidazole carboxamide ribotide isomerase|nr:HisA/HisF-related TIM barrel protein [Isosphaeraceae bacterium]